MSNRDTLIVALLLLLVFLWPKRPREKVESKLVLPNYENCGVAPSMLLPPKPIRWCIDPVTQLEFPFQLTTDRAMIFGLNDPALINRSLQLNRG